MIRVLYLIDGLRKGGKERRFLELVKKIDIINEIDYKIIVFHPEIEYEVPDSIIEKTIRIEKKSKKSIKPFFAIWAIVKQFKPDIIHTWSSMVTFYSLPSVIFTKSRLVNSQISDAPQRIRKFGFFYFVINLNFILSDVIISNSNSGLKSYRINNSKAICIYNGFDFHRTSNLKMKEEVKKNIGINDGYVIAMVASFSESKDYFTFLKSAKLISREESGITFLCIGGGDSTEYQSYAKSNKLDNVRFLGNQEDVESIMNVCDVGVLTTYTEGISNVIMEFNALGVPVVATNCGGNAEIIQHGFNGFLCKQGDEVNLTQNILKMLEDDCLRKRMGNIGRELVKEKFGIERMVDEFVKIYKVIN